MNNDIYIISEGGELRHYGVKGMKWGVRRDARLLANARRNKRVRSARDAYKSGKITKEDLDREVESAQRDKKKLLDKIKRDFENASTEEKREKISKDIVDKTTKEVPNATLKRGLAYVNTVFGATNIGSMGLSTYAIAVVNPAFAGAALAAGAVGVAAELGYRYVVQLGLDKAT